MNIDQHYQKIITGLESGARSLTRFSRDEIMELKEAFEADLTTLEIGRLEKILCLMDHSSTDETIFEPSIIRALNSNLPPRLMVFALNCSRKHILQARFKRGHRLEYDFLETLKKLLFSSSPEVVEWTLRTIEECGSQGVYFLSEFDKIKPPFWKWFNAHHRAVLEIITMLQRRWSRFEKQP